MTAEFHHNCCQACGWPHKFPGRIPDSTQFQMDEYPEIPKALFVCSTHGKWIAFFDPIFPYSFEQNKCKECK